jgi:hypothetical protein
MSIIAAMKETTALRLDVDLMNAMRQVKEADGIPITTQIEFAVRAWLTLRGVKLKSDSKRRPTSSNRSNRR